MVLRDKALYAASAVVLALGSGCAKPADACDSGADIGACCDALRRSCALDHVVNTDAYDECVFGPDFDGSTGCVPWGPPVPPRRAGR